jgi:hypothetical protein
MDLLAGFLHDHPEALFQKPIQARGIGVGKDAADMVIEEGCVLDHQVAGAGAIELLYDVSQGS